ncbi:MAG: cell division protein FtsX [Bacteroidetes bacterium GWF2_42_66]|nr:MAG: cell division protein FtsX [Bacteroidetes bacterium GWA2_42_15]OFX97881.1 MAG: cell division protein FtsX [Bacteroidetes bacterium GWE2_42_39]OFY44142.1 MAG: cell division protein FtsX [Bacteroidetes bacterium GWF2_42_66]HAZ03416.1 cell division protein FtsX [Marinilabiliales bacterium]HBL74613.1 cell division protein FtsX [Prolixibacteraceae bacterium]
MKKQKPLKLKRRVFRSYLSATVSISLVLFLFGLFGLLVLNADKLSDYVRENIGFTLVLHDDVKEIDVIRLQKILDASEPVKSTRFIDKETAAKQLQEDLGEDFQGFLGFNPLLSSIDVKLYAEYTRPDSIAVLEKEFLKYPQVKEVYYQRDLVNLINENVSKIGLFLIVFSVLLLFIFTSLINNTIRISVYSQRFIINTMQLVGATRGFIRKPFILRSITFGIIGALVSDALLALIFMTYKNEFAGIFKISGYETLGIVFLFVLAMGILISWLSTWFAVNKFLRLRFDELFY